MDKLNTTVESLFKGMDSFVSTKTVVGEPTQIGDTIIVPLADVSFGVAAGAVSEPNKNNGMGGLGGKITPSAVLVISNGSTRLVNVKNQDAITKLLDMVPDLLDRFAPVKDSKKDDIVEEI
ncbi:MAG: GerW family sporulation protein [Agathobacter sp.]|nr:GerW family sporulation protein [Agathobacter sp.]